MATLRLPSRVHYRPAMGFTEIARELGTTRKAVCFVYLRAMNKIARRPHALRQLAEAVAQAQARRQTGLSRVCPQAE